MRKWLMGLFAMAFPIIFGAANVQVVAEVETTHISRASVDTYDYPSLQRGAKIFMNYCIGCHGLRYARYERIADDLGIPSAIFIDNLLGTGYRMTDHVRSTVQKQDAQAWFNQAVPPDLTLVARVRGADWIYSFLRSYYRDSESLTGWNNLVFQNTAMPHVLHGLQDTLLVASEVSTEEGTVLAEAVKGNVNSVFYDNVVLDITNFLVYVGDPGKHFRIRAGIYTLLFLLVLLVYTHLLYREYWQDIK